MLSYLHHFIDLFIESAPWLLLGFTVAGLIKSAIPQDLLIRHLGGKGHGATIKAAVIGAPLPLCSCGVVPAALGLRKAGASKNATVSFLVATPETGVDSIAVTYALLGPVMAVVRPIAAISSGILSGLLVGKTERREVAEPTTVKISCCASKQEAAEAAAEVSCCSKQVEPEKKTGCCSKNREAKPQTTWVQRLSGGLRFSFDDMLRDIALWLLIGLAFAAAVKTWIPASFLVQWGDGWLAFVVMALIGVPMYICATASTPIAAGLLLSGVSPGAVLVFMMAGPATNIGTLGIIAKEMGRRTLVAYLSGVLIASFAFGYLTNLLFAASGIDVLTQAGHSHAASEGLFGTLSALILAALLSRVLWQQHISKWLPKKTEPSGCH